MTKFSPLNVAAYDADPATIRRVWGAVPSGNDAARKVATHGVTYARRRFAMPSALTIGFIACLALGFAVVAYAM